MRKNIRNITWLILLGNFCCLFWVAGQTEMPQSEPYLIIRGDDIGSSHASNVACIQAYRNGIMKSTELMVPGPWFPEAVKMLKDNPGLDVGVHLVVTSEWDNIKWRPLTCCPSLVDKDGYFLPSIWPRQNAPAGTALKETAWKPEEIEKEFRAQIEQAKKYVPRISHVNCHMGCESCALEIAALVKRLAVEYNLDIDLDELGFQYLPLWERNDSTSQQRTLSTIKVLKNLTAGRYYFIEHPGMNTPEMQAIGHPGYEDVAIDREAVTHVFTSKEVMDIIRAKGISLVSYREAALLK